MSKGRFGIHGGQYIPETLMNAVLELEEAYNRYKDDPEFNRELTDLLNNYAGRPSRLYYAAHMTEDLGGAKVYLKREDLNHTGAHKINNVSDQICHFLKFFLCFLVRIFQVVQHDSCDQKYFLSVMVKGDHLVKKHQIHVSEIRIFVFAKL